MRSFPDVHRSAPASRGDVRLNKQSGTFWLLFLLAHPRSVDNTDQQSFRRKQASYYLPPRFFAGRDKKFISLFRQFFRCRFYIFHIELEPCLGNRNVFGPRIRSEARLRSLRKRPQGKMLDPLHLLRMEIAALPLFKRHAEIFYIEFPARFVVLNDRAKTGDEQNFDTFRIFHTFNNRIKSSMTAPNV